jgi:endoglucanase
MPFSSFPTLARRFAVATILAVVLSPHVQAQGTRPAVVALAVHPEAIPSVPMRRTGTIAAADWAVFKARFIRDDGKLVDSFSQLSHSEGQGYAMLLALAADDRPTFDKVWTWTRTNLKRDGDSLLAWNWKPAASGGGAIGDSNDATDGDILVAWALHRAARQWQVSAYDDAARPIASDVLTKLVRDVAGFAVLTPGLDGFEHDGTITINLSYWIFPAFLSLNEIVPSLRWYELERSGLYFLSVARFGKAQLPSDWMVLKPIAGGGLQIALSQDKPLCGFDAIRIPLYLLWDRKATAETLAPFLAYWKGTADNKIPATVNLATGAVSSYPIPPGMQAIVAAAETRSSQPDRRVGPALIPTLPALAEDKDYYSAALGLLVRLALSETS